jgi:hypothetical protein
MIPKRMPIMGLGKGKAVIKPFALMCRRDPFAEGFLTSPYRRFMDSYQKKQVCLKQFFVLEIVNI